MFVLRSLGLFASWERVRHCHSVSLQGSSGEEITVWCTDPSLEEITICTVSNNTNRKATLACHLQCIPIYNQMLINSYVAYAIESDVYKEPISKVIARYIALIDFNSYCCFLQLLYHLTVLKSSYNKGYIVSVGYQCHKERILTTDKLKVTMHTSYFPLFIKQTNK